MTLMNDEKSLQQKTVETLTVASKWEMNSEILAMPIAYEVNSLK